MKPIISRLWNSPTFTTWASLFARLGSVAVLLPLVLVRFTQEDVALWLLLTTIASLQVLADLGLSQTFARAIANARGGASLRQLSDLRRQADAEDCSPADMQARVIQTLEPTYRLAAVAFLLLLAVVGTYFVTPSVLRSSGVNQGWAAWAIVAASTAVVVWGNAFIAYLTGSERVPLLRRWEAAFALAGLASAAAVLTLGGSLVVLVAVQQAWAVAAVLRNRWICRSDQRFMEAAGLGLDPEVLKALWPNAWRSGVGVALSFGVIQLSALLYARLQEVGVVATYLLAMRLMQALSTIAQAPFYSKLPTLARLKAAGNDDELLRLASRGMRGAHLTYCIGFLVIGFAVPPVLQVIGSRTEFASPQLWSLLGVAFFLERYGAMHLQLYSTTNHIIWHKANGLTGAGMLLLSLALYSMLGVLAFPLSMTIAYGLIYCPMALVHSYRQFKLKFWPFDGGSAVVPLIATVLIWVAGGVVVPSARWIHIPGIAQ